MRKSIKTWPIITVLLFFGTLLVSQTGAHEGHTHDSQLPETKGQRGPVDPAEKAAQMRQMMQVQSMQQFMQADPKRGRQIFNDPQLGSSGKSCADCHEYQGAKIMRQRNVDFHLAASVQSCYANALKGKGVIAKDKLNDLLSFLLAKVRTQKRQEEQSGTHKH